MPKLHAPCGFRMFLPLSHGWQLVENNALQVQSYVCRAAKMRIMFDGFSSHLHAMGIQSQSRHCRLRPSNTQDPASFAQRWMKKHSTGTSFYHPRKTTRHFLGHLRYSTGFGIYFTTSSTLPLSCFSLVGFIPSD